MKNKILLVSFYSLLVGCASHRYPNWEYVRIENQTPDKNCIYKMQDACASGGTGCFNWYKQRATTFGANTVVITQSESQKRFSAGVFSAGGGDTSSKVADYYFCNGAKNLTPPK